MMTRFEIPIFDVTVFFVVAEDPVAARNAPELVAIFGPNEDGDDWDGICLCPVQDSEGRACFAVILKQTKLSRNLFAHEMFHLTHSILEHHEIECEETGALLHGYLCGELGKHIG